MKYYTSHSNNHAIEKNLKIVIRKGNSKKSNFFIREN